MAQRQEPWMPHALQVVQHEGEKSIADGGFILQCGVDIRDLIEEPQ